MSRSRPAVWLVVFSLMSGLTFPAQALMYVHSTDDSLLDRADVVVIGEITQAAEDQAAALDLSRYELQVEEVLKGGLTQDTVQIRVPGSFNPGRSGSLVIPGAPRFDLGERVLVFLNPHDDGTYTVTQFVLGAFHIRAASSGLEIAQRVLSGAHPFNANSPELSVDEENEVRTFDGFRDWLRTRAAGRSGNQSYWIPKPQTPKAMTVPLKFTTLSNIPARWFEFDEGRSVALYASETGQTGVSGGGYRELQQAMAAWNDDRGSNVRYTYGGLTSASGGLDNPDGVNSVLFNDPNNYLEGVFDCIKGGVLAYSGYRSGPARSFNGGQFQPIIEVDVVIQNGAGCALSGSRSADARELFAHELGHTLGLGHSCGDEGLLSCVLGSLLDDAVMRPYLHSDGRGADLNKDDLDGIAFLYPTNVTSSAGTAGASADSSSGGGGAVGLTTLAALMLLLGTATLQRRWTRFAGHPHHAF